MEKPYGPMALSMWPYGHPLALCPMDTHLLLGGALALCPMDTHLLLEDSPTLTIRGGGSCKLLKTLEGAFKSLHYTFIFN